MVELIQQLLLTHNCVIIPNFGAFIGNYNPAEIHLMERKIFPPNKMIAFNRSLQNNDGILINAVSRDFSVSYHEAEIRVADFVKQCNDSLFQNKSFILNDIGRLVVDTENNIQFQPYFSKNYLLDSFGLPVMSLQPVQRLKDAESIIKENYQRILHPELMEDAVTPKRKSSLSSYGFSAVLSILFIGFTIVVNLQRSSRNVDQASFIPVLSQPSSIVPLQQPMQVAEDTVIAEETIKMETLSTTTIENDLNNLSLENTYVVVGAFFTVARAEKLKEEVEKKGFSVSIIKDNSEKYYHTAIKLESAGADTVLQKIKTDINPGAWIYCIKCRL
ncbi:MAG TPA: hypothetical protein PLS10_01645 [Chitinophagales bacterium]|nr:hypothetical protein [Chitinophagales bacterium]